MYRKPLIAALTKYDRTELNKAIAPYKLPNGSPDYPKLLSVYERLPGMAQRDFETTLAMIVVALTKAFESMNLSRPMNDDQIIELAETIIESSNEDFLSLEDIVLFLQGLTRGKYGALYESMDIPKFMMLFEKYRQERHEALVEYRYEQHIQNKTLPVNDRIADMFPDELKEKIRAVKIDQMKKEANNE